MPGQLAAAVRVCVCVCVSQKGAGCPVSPVTAEAEVDPRFERRAGTELVMHHDLLGEEGTPTL